MANLIDNTAPIARAEAPARDVRSDAADARAARHPERDRRGKGSAKRRAPPAATAAGHGKGRDSNQR